MNKRSITLFLILSLLLGAVIATAAEPMTDIDDNPHKHAIELMVELGVLSGRGHGLFYPDDNLTRAEAATVAMILLGFSQQDADEAKALHRAFDDVYVGMGAHEWAVGWINLAAERGIIAGYGGGKYGPGDKLQMAQWAAILIRILGYDTGSLAWPTGYDQIADELGITEQLEYISNAIVKRDQMAQFTANAVYNVERPDGTKILDIFVNEEEIPEEPEEPGEPEKPEVPKPKSVKVSFDIPEALPEGGGQKATLTATATDQDGNPVKDVKIRFEAGVREYDDRNSQLSKLEVLTDASGKASVTYTTLAKDDKKIMSVNVAAFHDDPNYEYFNYYNITIANKTARISGVFTNPFTGAPLKDFHIHFMIGDTENEIGMAETDVNGRYSVLVPTGTYKMAIVLELEERMFSQMWVNAATAGKTYTMDYNWGVIKGKLPNVSPGNNVIAYDSTLEPYDPDAWSLDPEIQRDGSFILILPPRSKAYELFITGDDTPFITGVTVKTGQVTDLGTLDNVYWYW